MSISEIRHDYASRELNEVTADDDPIRQFGAWFDEARRAQLLDVNAMTLATVDARGDPAARTVLLKGVDDRGFTFFTNYDSAKGADLAGTPRACLLFFWVALERQVRVTGSVTKVSVAESEEYFQSRPVGSQLAAWASAQSRVVPDRAALEHAYDQMARKYPAPPIPLPPFWGGYRVASERIEFWQGRPSRLHDRLLYTRDEEGGWSRVRLAP